MVDLLTVHRREQLTDAPAPMSRPLSADTAAVIAHQLGSTPQQHTKHRAKPSAGSTCRERRQCLAVVSMQARVPAS